MNKGNIWLIKHKSSYYSSYYYFGTIFLYFKASTSRIAVTRQMPTVFPVQTENHPVWDCQMVPSLLWTDCGDQTMSTATRIEPWGGTNVNWDPSILFWKLAQTRLTKVSTMYLNCILWVCILADNSSWWHKEALKEIWYVYKLKW